MKLQGWGDIEALVERSRREIDRRYAKIRAAAEKARRVLERIAPGAAR